MSDTQKLLPCPFCAAAPSTAHQGKYAFCDSCEALPHVLVPAELWNRRATPPEDNRLREALIFANDMLDQLINRHYGGELPCSAAEANGFKKIRAALSHGEDNGK